MLYILFGVTPKKNLQLLQFELRYIPYTTTTHNKGKVWVKVIWMKTAALVEPCGPFY